MPEAFGLTKLAVSDYKGVSYARKFPDTKKIYARDTPFGFIEVYSRVRTCISRPACRTTPPST